ncbi:FAD-binding-3 domain-containing protein [Favolaschia claudopus]|uniref:FAD-binding-3 domain-containing protein n=1 Tax=Favolaschia claudopus TaxID=2862362 RepID=A0AAW0DH97_9AGAR
MDKPSVLIVGAGPSGLVLALILLKYGVSVRIIDKQTSHSKGSRGAAIQPRTLELYDILGILPDILKAGELLRPSIAKYEHGETNPTTFVKVVDIMEPSPDTPYPNTYYVDQEIHEKILRSHLLRLACNVELGSEFRGLEQFPGHVVAHIEKTDSMGNKVKETASFDWLVGTDGARSAVRKQIGIEYAGETRAQYIAIGDIVVEQGVDPKFWHMWDESPNSIIFRPSGVKDLSFMFFYTGRSEELVDKPITRQEFVDRFYEITGRHDVRFGPAPWLSIYRPNMRMVKQMHVGRVFLAGDAAHCHSPTGGQGLNSGVHDAFNLGWKLALVHKGHASQTLLATYDQERIRVITHMLKVTTELHDSSLHRLHAGEKMTNESWARGGDIQMMGINYSGSPIILQEPDAVTGISNPYSRPIGTGPADVQAAYRAPDAPGLVFIGSGESENGKTTTLFSVFSVTVHTVLLFGSDGDCGEHVSEVTACLPLGVAQAVRVLPQGESLSGSSSYEVILEDRDAHAYAVYGVPLNNLTAVIVRPDGVVGAVASSKDGVDRYFRNFCQI